MSHDGFQPIENDTKAAHEVGFFVLFGVQAAINRHGMAGDKRGGIRAEPQDGLRHFLRLA